MSQPPHAGGGGYQALCSSPPPGPLQASHRSPTKLRPSGPSLFFMDGHRASQKPDHGAGAPGCHLKQGAGVTHACRMSPFLCQDRVGKQPRISSFQSSQRRPLYRAWAREALRDVTEVLRRTELPLGPPCAQGSLGLLWGTPCANATPSL